MKKFTTIVGVLMCIKTHCCLLKCGSRQEIHEFGAATREILELADWISSGKCKITAMESTVSYWKLLYNIFESSGLNAMVVNAAT